MHGTPSGWTALARRAQQTRDEIRQQPPPFRSYDFGPNLVFYAVVGAFALLTLGFVLELVRWWETGDFNAAIVLFMVLGGLAIVAAHHRRTARIRLRNQLEEAARYLGLKMTQNEVALRNELNWLDAHAWGPAPSIDNLTHLAHFRFGMIGELGAHVVMLSLVSQDEYLPGEEGPDGEQHGSRRVVEHVSVYLAAGPTPPVVNDTVRELARSWGFTLLTSPAGVCASRNEASPLVVRRAAKLARALCALPMDD